MSSNCTFDFHISNLSKRCSNISGWILRTFTMSNPQVMLTLFKSLVMSRHDYTSQLWSPYLLKHVYLIEKVQRAFTKDITGMWPPQLIKHIINTRVSCIPTFNKPYGSMLHPLNFITVVLSVRRTDRTLRSQTVFHKRVNQRKVSSLLKLLWVA